MSTFVIRCRCGGDITTESIEPEVIHPALLEASGHKDPGCVAAWRWVCEDCGEEVGRVYDYGTLDLGVVR